MATQGGENDKLQGGHALEKIQRGFADAAAKAGIPRSESIQETMIDDAKDRATGVSRSAHNSLHHGRRIGKLGMRSSI